MTPSINVPVFPRLEEYAGLWALEPKAAHAYWEAVHKLDLKVHVNQPEARVESGLETIPIGNGRKIAVIKAVGLMMKQQSSFTQSTSTIQLRRDLRTAANDSEIAGVLLAIDSPGGSVAGTEDLAAEVRATREKKPVYAQIEDLGASAAYWLASQADQVFANNATALVGSIGTLLVLYDQSAAAEKEGVKTLVFATGPLKGAGTPGSQINAEQQAYFQGLANQTQAHFDAAVKAGRRLSDAQLADVKTGGVFMAQEALTRGLVDGIQSLEATIGALSAAVARKRTDPSAKISHGSKGATTMKFEEWLSANGFSAETLNEAQLAKLNVAFESDMRAKSAPKQPGGDGASLMGDLEAQTRQRRAEESRMAEIRRLCRQANDPVIEVEGQKVSLEAHAIVEGWSKQEVSLEILRGKRPTAPPPPGGRGHVNAWVVMEAAIAQAGNLRNLDKNFSDQVLDAAHKEYHGRIGLQEMLLIAAAENGWAGRGHKIHDGNIQEILQASFSTNNLSGILSNIANKFLVEGFLSVEQSWRDIASIRPVNDFKTVTDFRLISYFKLEKVPKDGKLPHGTLGETKYTNQAETYGKQFGVPRTDIINDDLHAYTGLGTELGEGGGDALNETFWTEFLDNASFFTSGNGNYFSGSSTNLQHSSLATAVQMFLQIKGENNRPSNLVPSILLHPPQLMVTANELYKASNFAFSTSTKQPNVNTLQGLYRPVTARKLGDDSATAFYVLAAPRQNNGAIEVVFLNNVQIPTVQMAEADFGELGIKLRAFFDFGVKKKEWRFGVKSKGAA